jgi:hypothetical protein
MLSNFGVDGPAVDSWANCTTEIQVDAASWRTCAKGSIMIADHNHVQVNPVDGSIQTQQLLERWSQTIPRGEQDAGIIIAAV